MICISLSISKIKKSFPKETLNPRDLFFNKSASLESRRSFALVTQ